MHFEYLLSNTNFSEHLSAVSLKNYKVERNPRCDLTILLFHNLIHGILPSSTNVCYEHLVMVNVLFQNIREKTYVLVISECIFNEKL